MALTALRCQRRNPVIERGVIVENDSQTSSGNLGFQLSGHKDVLVMEPGTAVRHRLDNVSRFRMPVRSPQPYAHLRQLEKTGIGPQLIPYITDENPAALGKQRTRFVDSGM